nr:inactive Ufm1-specific protease 1 isoform X3 [Syngnathus scovelli]
MGMGGLGRSTPTPSTARADDHSLTRTWRCYPQPDNQTWSSNSAGASRVSFSCMHKPKPGDEPNQGAEGPPHWPLHCSPLLELQRNAKNKYSPEFCYKHTEEENRCTKTGSRCKRVISAFETEKTR